MPLPVESLTKKSSAKAVREAISSSIAQCIEEGGRSDKECQGMVFGIAKRKTGSTIRRGLEE